MAALAGVGVGGAIGGLTGALVGMGIPEYEAKRYEGRVKNGGILLSVHSDNSEWTRRAKEILERTSAEDIASTGETKGDFDNTDKPMPRGEAVVDERSRPVTRDASRVVTESERVVAKESVLGDIDPTPETRPNRKW
jgi:hypothetical protein